MKCKIMLSNIIHMVFAVDSEHTSPKRMKLQY